jgi:hypothetical protein
MADAELVVHLDRALPDHADVGRGSVLYLTGRCYHPIRSLRALWASLDGAEHRVWNHSATRADVPSPDPAVDDATPNSLVSGFWAALPVPADPGPRRVRLRFRAELDDGELREIEVGSLEIRPTAVRESAPVSTLPRVAICVATADADPHRLAAQIASLVRQKHQHWSCLVADDASAPERLHEMRALVGEDPRFAIVTHPTRLGAYDNLAHTLSAIPHDAEIIAIMPEGAVWDPTMLTRALAAFHPATMLVAEHPETAGTDLADLLFAEVPARRGSTFFRATLIPDLVPFPPCIGEAAVERWIACVAAARGSLAALPMGAGSRALGPSMRRSRHAARSGDVRSRIMAELWNLRTDYDEELVGRIVMAKILLRRLGTATSAGKRAALARVADLERAPLGLVRHIVGAAGRGRWAAVPEWRCLAGTIAAKTLDAYYRRNRARLFDDRIVRAEITGAHAEVSATSGLKIVEQKMAPLRLSVGATEPRRVNVLTPAIDFRHLFAGYLGKLNLALRLTDVGYAVRLVIVDPCAYDPPSWRRTIAEYPGLEGFFDRVEVAYAADRGVSLPVHASDAFVATTWWTAHVAHRATREIGRDRFLYLVQEYEPMTFPMGSLHALAAASYTYPHVALFSSELLRDYFRAGRIGVYGGAGRGDGADGHVFQNAIASFDVTPERLARAGRRRLLFYARPEQHAARNMFEIGVLALRRAVEAGALDPATWVVDGIGAGRAFEPIPLGHGTRLSLLPRMSLAEYQRTLPSYDVGLSLMLTPHPSLVPLEMAAAGMVTVTNTFANKTADALRALSANLIGAAPTIEGVGDAIAVATTRADDRVARAAGSRVAWSRDWRTSLDDALLARLRDVLDGPRRP